MADSTKLDHRNFLLNLSLKHGQDFATHSGFLPAPESATMESIDVLRNWMVLKGAGILDPVSETSAWMTILESEKDWDVDQWQTMYETFCAFAASTIMRLHNDGLIQFAHVPDIVLAEYDPVSEKAVPIDPLNYSYKDIIGHLDFEPDLSDLLTEEDDE